MDTAMRCLRGDFRPREVPRYLAFISVTFWSIIFAAWVVYPDDRPFCIMIHTFSALGSFNADRNPTGWWLFSIAMLFWGTSAMPVVLYISRRLTAISAWAAVPARVFMLIGCVGMALVGVFPDARGTVIGDWQWTHIHTKVALTAAGGFVLGTAWAGLVIGADALLHRRRQPRIARWSLLPPYILLEGMCSITAYHLIKWEFVYADMKAAAIAAGQQIGSSWSEAIKTRYSFPLWENLTIYTLFIFLIWFTYMLSRSAREVR